MVSDKTIYKAFRIHKTVFHIRINKIHYRFCFPLFTKTIHFDDKFNQVNIMKCIWFQDFVITKDSGYTYLEKKTWN